MLVRWIDWKRNLLAEHDVDWEEAGTVVHKAKIVLTFFLFRT